MKPVADLRLHLLRRGAKRKAPILVSIGVPRPAGDSNWYCPVRLKGLIDSKERRIIGVDSWQALTLTLRFVKIMLRAEVQDGGELFHLGRKTTVDDLFADHPHG